MNLELTINDEPSEIASTAELHAALVAAEAMQFRKIWLNSGGSPTICALLNGDIGWLMYLRYNGDAGFSSRNPNYRGDPDAATDYLLSNGQMDQYPTSWALPRAEVYAALAHFFEHRARAPSVQWHDDGG